MKFSSLAALEDLILITFGATSGENLVKMTMFAFQCPDALAPCITRSSAPIVLTMYDEHIIAFHEKKSNLYHLSAEKL